MPQLENITPQHNLRHRRQVINDNAGMSEIQILNEKVKIHPAAFALIASCTLAGGVLQYGNKKFEEELSCLTNEAKEVLKNLNHPPSIILDNFGAYCCAGAILGKCTADKMHLSTNARTESSAARSGAVLASVIISAHKILEKSASN